jgi:GATA-binding protein, other eukaryote
MRHPSAEDLDAAEQLLSSARGRQPYIFDLQQEVTTTRDDRRQAWSEGPRVEMDMTAEGLAQHEMDTAPGSETPFCRQSQGKDASFWGHSCRCESLLGQGPREIQR